MGMFSSLKGLAAVAAPIAGAYFGGPMGAQIGSMIGGQIAGRQQAKQAGETAAQYDARLRQLGQQGFFRPVTSKTLYGESKYKTDPNTGALIEAGYTGSDQVQEDQGRLGDLMQTGLSTAEAAAQAAPQYQTAAQGLFDLGQSYLSGTPEEARNRYMQQQMDVLRPYDIEEEQRLGRTVFGKGAGGLSVGAGGNPYLQTLMESRNRRNLGLAAGADVAAQQQGTYGADKLREAGVTSGIGFDMMGGSLDPYQTYLNQQAGLEKLAQQPYAMGLDAATQAIGGQQFGSNMAQGGALGNAQVQMANTNNQNERLMGLLNNKDLINGVSGMFGNKPAEIVEKSSVYKPTTTPPYVGYQGGGFSGNLNLGRYMGNPNAGMFGNTR